MGVRERREREKEELRTAIIEAARDILSEKGLDALSMRAIARRIEYSPATLYLYFRDKNELIRNVVEEGFNRMGEYMRRELAAAGEEATAIERYRALGRAYLRFALDNTAYFRVMFELPTVAHMESPDPEGGSVPMTGEVSWDFSVRIIQQAIDDGLIDIPSAYRGALVGWGLIHGLVSLYLSGHLAEAIGTSEELGALVEEAMTSVHEGWRSRD